MPPVARTLALTVALAATALTPSAIAQKPTPKTPAMGWNSWDAYGLTITEPDFRANVNVLRDKLLPFGWRYAVIDEGWFFENPEARPTPDKLHYAIDSHGRYVPTPMRFPSTVVPPAPPPSQKPTTHAARKSARLPKGKATAPPTTPAAEAVIPDGKLAVTIEETSFAPLAKWVHEQGLLFGIHIVRGIPRASVERNLPIDALGKFRAQDAADQTDTCPWDPTNWGIKNNAAGQAWYNSLLKQYAAWGVDLLKVDCISDHPYKQDEIRMIRRAIDRSGRPMLLSLSPGPTSPRHVDAVSDLANMWRISDDVWDVWSSEPGKNFPQSIVGQFARAADWSSYDFEPDRRPDFDMLPLGELRPSPGWGKPRSTRLTPDEQQTMLALWALNRSPLILGANLTLLDEATLHLLTNRALIRIDQDATNGAVPVDGFPANMRVWSGELSSKGGNGHAGAVFNLGDTPVSVDQSLADLGLVGANGSPLATVLNVWTGASLGRIDKVHATIPPHGCLLLIAE